MRRWQAGGEAASSYCRSIQRSSGRARAVALHGLAGTDQPTRGAVARAIATEHGTPEYMGDLSVFQITLKNPCVIRALNGMLHNLLWKGQVDGRLRELIIMRIGSATGAVYEWAQHRRIATGASRKGSSRRN